MIEKKSPMALSVNGRAALVVQDAASYQNMIDRLERAETVAAIRHGIEAGRTWRRRLGGSGGGDTAEETRLFALRWLHVQ